MTALNAAQLGGRPESFVDLRDFLERSGSPFWMEEFHHSYDPDARSEFVLPIPTPENRTLMYIWAKGVEDETDTRPPTYSLAIWKRGHPSPAWELVNEYPSASYGVVYQNRPIAVARRFWWDSSANPVACQDISLDPNAGNVLVVRPMARCQLKIQLGGFKV